MEDSADTSSSATGACLVPVLVLCLLGTPLCACHDPHLANTITPFTREALPCGQRWIARPSCPVLFGVSYTLFLKVLSSVG